MTTQKVDNNDVAEAAKKASELDRKYHLEHLENLARLKQDLVIQRVEPIWEGAAVTSAPDSLFDFEYLELQRLWTQYGIRGQGVKVYVIDTGIDNSHPAFAHQKGKMLSFIEAEPNPKDGNGHGTWVCGKIGGAGIGIAPKCDLYSLRTLDDAGTGTADASTAALKHVLADKDANLVNMSLGSFQKSAAQERIVKQLAAEGVLICAAAGNSNSNLPFYPASFEPLLAVSAFDKRETKAEFSNYGGYVDISAPGVSCYSTYLEGKFRKLSGTSMATPIVTGLLTLGMSFLKLRHPGLDRKDIKKIAMETLLRTAKDLGAAGRDDIYGFGGLNAVAFVDALSKG